MSPNYESPVFLDIICPPSVCSQVFMFKLSSFSSGQVIWVLFNFLVFLSCSYVLVNFFGLY